MKTRDDIYTRVTDSFVASLEQGVRPWLKPWNADYASTRIYNLPRRYNGVPYRGINILLLWAASLEKCYTGNIWTTFRQTFELGANVRKGEHGSQVVYCDRLTQSNINEKGEEAELQIAFLRTYSVFNVDQIENLPAKYLEGPPVVAQPMALIEQAEVFFVATRANFHYGVIKRSTHQLPI